MCLTVPYGRPSCLCARPASMWQRHDLLATVARLAPGRVWDHLHRVLLDRFVRADQIDWARAALDAASVPAPRGATKPGRTRRIAARLGRSATSVSMVAARPRPSAIWPPTGMRPCNWQRWWTRFLRSDGHAGPKGRGYAVMDDAECAQAIAVMAYHPESDSPAPSGWCRRTHAIMRAAKRDGFAGANGISFHQLTSRLMLIAVPWQHAADGF
jgi:hypothetical protein